MRFTIDCPINKLRTCYTAVNHALEDRSKEEPNKVFGTFITSNVGGDHFLIDHKVDEISVELISKEVAIKLKAQWRMKRLGL